MNIANFDKFIDNDVEAENFTTERSAERRRLAYLIVQLLTTERYLSKGNHGVKQTYPGIRRKVSTDMSVSIICFLSSKN